MTTLQRYDRVIVATCPAHNPTAEDADRGLEFPADICWCRGQIQRVFADGNLLISGRKGKVALFPPEAVVRE